MCHCRFSAYGIRNPFDGGTLFPCNGDVDGSGSFCLPADNGGILPVNRMLSDCCRQDAGAQAVFCEQKKTGRIAVQPVDSPENKILMLFP